MPLSDGDLVDLLHDTANAIGTVLSGLVDWGLAGTRAGQHHSDLAADEAALAVLGRAGVGVLSEESGRHWVGRDVVVVVDPLDGSTNASRGIPWYAISLCAVDAEGPRVALVVDVPHGLRYHAVRGGGRASAGRGGGRWSGCRDFPADGSGGSSTGRWGQRRSTCARSRRACWTRTSTAAGPPTGCGTTWAAC